MKSLTAKAIIFDMDGVLVNSEPHHVAIEKEMFKQLGLNISDQEHSTYMGKATDIMWKEIIRDKKLSLESKELVAQTVELSKIHFASQEDLKPMEGLVDQLEKLNKKSIPMSVASSSGQEIIDIILERTGLKKYFLHTVSSELVGGSKPEPDIFLHTAKLMGVYPEECVVVEDSTNGVKAAKAANMYCIAYTGALAGFQDLGPADVKINHYSELEGILEDLIF